MKELIKSINEFFEYSEELRPVIKKGFEILKSYGPEIYDLTYNMAINSAKIRADVVKVFEKEGFTREEAIFLTMDEWWGIKKNINKSQNRIN